MSGIRTRYAPSPTGFMHIGNLRTALYAFLLAKGSHGTFILRIEDTDQDRYVEGAVKVIFDTLRIVGLTHDEGPDVGGDYGPYVQSERRPIYRKYIDELLVKGNAYRCFCSKERLEAVRLACMEQKQPFLYDRHCLHLSQAEVDAKLAAGEPFVIRQRIPEGTTTFEDVVYGSITVDNATLEDAVLIKSDGMPTYNFANVIDDHLMKITHVIRGSEYLSSTPKYNLLYQAFGWEIPTYIHMPLITNSSGKKLSKREGDASFFDLLNKGYLKDAVINYIALLGWSPGTEEEFFTLPELIERFSLEGLSKSPAIFNVDKLRWMNGEYIRKLNLDEFHAMAMPYYESSVKRSDIDWLTLSRVLQPRVNVLSEIPDNIDFLDHVPEYDVTLYENKKMKTSPDTAREVLPSARKTLANLGVWTETSIHDALMALVVELGAKNGQVLWPVRVALSGKQSTPGGAIELAALFPQSEVVRRIDEAIQKLEALR